MLRVNCMTTSRSGRTTFFRSLVSSAIRWRLSFFRTVLFFVGVTIIGRLYVLQVLGRERWIVLAQDQHIVNHSLLAERGTIIIRDGDHTSPVAVNREYKTIYAVPKLIDDVPVTIAALASSLGLDETAVRAKFSDRSDPFEIIKKKVTPEEEARIRELRLPGINFLPEIGRYYPADDLAAQTIGFVRPADDGGEVGAYGVEASWDDELHGHDGVVAQERDASGRWIALSDREQTPPEDGKSLVLTIDRVIQYEVERILSENRETFGADSASAIVLEPKTGKILAMAVTPSFNLNEYNKEQDLSHFLNSLVSLPYESGSVMKPITMAIGMNEGKVSPETEFIDTGSVTEGGYTIRNAESKVYGRSTMTKVLEQSINTGVMYVERLVGNEAFRNDLRRFGFGSRSGIRLPAENPGNLHNLDNLKSSVEFLTASFGQGITVTPLQLVLAYGALANGGVLMKPQIVDRIISDDGSVENVAPEEVERVVSQDTAEKISMMLRSVVVHGHGKRADVPGYLVAGKTGTAQVAKHGSSGYDEYQTIGSFAGYAPLNDPRFVVLVKFDHPTNVEWAESSAAPVFGEIMKFLLSYAKVPTTEPIPKATP